MAADHQNISSDLRQSSSESCGTVRAKAHFELFFRLSAVTILIAAAAAKLYSVAGHAPILDTEDPLFGFSNRRLLTLLGLLEILVAGVLLSNLNRHWKYLLLAWLSTGFVVYRFALGVLAIGKPCPCLGTLTETMHLKPETVSYILTLAVVYLLVSSIWLLAKSRRTSSLESIVAK
ncbi:MAG: hypothetical protein L0Z50_32605 [Verrucomicrobiales bacterium]|nr:hypothetical protein [Verrucomicrobiales bacterium]